MRRVIALFCAAAGALVFANAAFAGYWHYGPAWLGHGHDDANCIFYRGQASCSGWNNWTDVHYSKQAQADCCIFTYHLGYENNSVIRGAFVYNYYLSVDLMGPGQYGMGPYVEAEITYWSGDPVYVFAWANA